MGSRHQRRTPVEERPLKIGGAEFLDRKLRLAPVEATTGQIEEQEKAGQAALAGSGKAFLPRESNLDRLTVTKRTGILFHEDADELFVQVTLPPGWSIQPTEHALYTVLQDAAGKLQAEVFYKAAFYDRKADITWKLIETTDLKPLDGSRPV